MTDDSGEESALLFVAARDPEKFAPIYERYFPKIYGYCLRRLGNVQDAEDLTAHIFAHVLANLDQYRGGYVPAWLFRIAHNVLINYRKRQQPDIPLDDIADAFEHTPMIESLIETQDAALIGELVRQLPSQQQQVLLLKVVAGWSSDQIGKSLGKSAGAIRVMIHRTIQQLGRDFRDRQRE